MMLKIGRTLFSLTVGFLTSIVFGHIVAYGWNHIISTRSSQMTIDWQTATGSIVLITMIRMFITLPDYLAAANIDGNGKKIEREFSALIMLFVFCPITFIMITLWSIILR